MKVSAPESVSVDVAFTELQHLCRTARAGVPAPGARSLLLVDDAGDAARHVLARFRRDAMKDDRVLVAEGRCEPDVPAPYAPFSDIVASVAGWARQTDVALLEKYAGPLVSVVPRLADMDVLHGAVASRAGMAAHCFRGHRHELNEFFQGRDVSPWLTDAIVRFLLDASACQDQLVVICQDMQDADPQGLRIFRLLTRYAYSRSLVVCGVFRSPAAAVLGDVVESGDCRIISLVSSQGGRDVVSAAYRRLTPDAQRLLAAACALRRPADADDLWTMAQLETQETAANRITELTNAGLIDEWSDHRLAVPRHVRVVVDDLLDHRARPHLHAVALTLKGTRTDPYQHAYHADAANAEPATALRRAIETAWGACGYNAALHYAHRFIAVGAPGLQVDPRLLLFFLLNGAGAGAAADVQVADVLASPPGDANLGYLNQLRGYNAAFVTRDLDLALRHFRLAVDYCKRHGPSWNVGWIQNSMAFVLNQQGKTAEALTLEREAFDGARDHGRSHRFLSTILHLNLGRLHRSHAPGTATTLIRTSIERSAGELTVHHLLLSYLTLHNLAYMGGRQSDALAYLRLSVSLFNDQGVAFTKRMLPILSRRFTEQVGPLDADRLLVSDQMELCVAFNFASVHDALGQDVQASEYRRWLRRRLQELREHRCALASAVVGPRRMTVGTDDDQPRASVKVAPMKGLATHGDVLRVWTSADAADDAAAVLADGRPVAWLQTHSSPRAPFDSLVLLDPRSQRLRRRIVADLGQSDDAGAVLTLPDGAAWFDGVETGWPLVGQAGTLHRPFRDRVPGVQAIRARVHVVSPEGPCELGAVVAAFCERTTVPLLTILAFQVDGEEIATTATMAAKYLLETHIDLLVCDGMLVEKRRGVAAPDNIAELKPQFCGKFIDSADARSSRDGSGLLVSRGRRVRVALPSRRLLEQCDGQKTVAQLHAVHGDQGDVFTFFRRARLAGMVRFNL